MKMRDLLADNVALGRHLEDIRGSLGVTVVQVASRPWVWEVTSLMCCFLAFLAVGTSDPITRERLAYAILIVREFMRHGGSAWLEYDCLFRQQAAIDTSLRWNVLHPGLQASMILSQRWAGAGLLCQICQGCDHSSTLCALAQVQQSTTTGSTNTHPQSGRPQVRCVTRAMMVRVHSQVHAHLGMCAPTVATPPTEKGTVVCHPVGGPLQRHLCQG